MVANGDGECFVFLANTGDDRRAEGGIFDRVAEEVVDDLSNFCSVDDGYDGRTDGLELDDGVFRCGGYLVKVNGFCDEIGQVGRSWRKFELAGFDDRHVEEFVDQVEHMGARVAKHRNDFSLFWIEGAHGTFVEKSGHATDGGEGVAKVVRRHAQELVFERQGLTELTDEQAVGEVGADAGNGFAFRNRFCEVVDTAGGKTGKDVFRGISCGNEDDRWAIRFVEFLNFAAGGEAVDAGQMDVEYDQVGFKGSAFFDGDFP